MSHSLFSSSWHLVKALRPRLRDHLEVHRHHYRGELWFILQDHAAQRSFRFTPTANFIFSQMDGIKTVNDLWHIANDELGDEAPTQDEMIGLLGQLHSADALQSDLSPVVDELLQRQQKNRRTRLTRQLLNPLSVKIPLLDPDTFLEKTAALVKPLFGWFGLTLWIAFVGSALVLTGVYWSELTHNISDQVLTPQNLLIIWLIYPVIKAFHELAHAYATKIWGGEVHEIGIMFLVFMPVPYVDASAASAFRQKHRRMVVGAAGIFTELFIASLALLVWINIEPGVVRAVAYNIILIAGVSTLFFNGNPLLRFDGYYIFSDWLEIQNLAARANRHLGFLCQRYLFGLKNLEAPVSTPGERWWFVFYSIASYVYRMFIAFFIVLFVGGKFFFIGVVLAAWSVIMLVIVPFVKTLSKVFTSPQIAPRRTRAITVTMTSIAAVVLAILLAPAPSWTRVQGVVSIPEDAIVRPESDCFVKKFLASPGSEVKSGDPLVACQNIDLLARAARLKQRRIELSLIYAAQLQQDKVEAEITREELLLVNADLDDTMLQVRNLTITSDADGVFVVPYARDLPGRFLVKGQEFAYTLQNASRVKIAISQDDIDLIRQRTRRVEVRLSEALDEVLVASVLRLVPAATDELPSLALAQNGGGDIATVPDEDGGVRAFDKIFVLDLELPRPVTSGMVGGRVYARFDHGYEPLARQWYREIRQLFLERFSV